MIISPPFLLPVDAGLTAEDPLMDKLDKMTDSDGLYPIAFDRRWHTGLHLVPSDDLSLPVRAIADGEVVAYRVCQQPIEGVSDSKNTNTGFVLLKHTTETGDGRTLTFYSLYMHLLDLNTMTQDGILPPPVNEAHSMPEWLRTRDTGGPVTGEGKKVRRKDILGYVGRCQGGRWHLHFEIFMAPADFEAYFGATQLGRQYVTTSEGSDCWGHSYHVIPAHQTFLAQPPGVDAHHKLNGIEFLPKQAGQNERPLYVEVYFHKGDKYTNVWSVADDGSRTLLTDRDPESRQPRPVSETAFEYDMYKRACALYPACPSDGYEMLRFGRILSQPETLPPVPDQETSTTPNRRKTWYCIPFGDGQQGYIDISKSTIKKLSDADFPFFMGWRRIQTSDVLFDANGLWDTDKFKELVRTSVGHVGLPDTNSATSEQSAQQRSEAMRHYVSDSDHQAVRDLLRGFICEAPSEWDSANLEDRYRNLLDEGEHFEGKQEACNKFLDFVKKLQFWDKTGLPAGGKVWFFHPLAFIRHFRKCGWLTQDELAASFPRYPFYTGSGSPRRAVSTETDIYRITKDIARRRVANHVTALNKCIRKYMGSDQKRIALFLAQVLLETAQWRNLGGTKRLMHEWGFGQYSAANPATQYYGPFYGRGIMQLTWVSNFDAYGKYKKIPNHLDVYVERLAGITPRITGNSRHYSAHPDDGGHLMVWAPRYDPDVVAEDPDYACDSGGFYWVSKEFSSGPNINRVSDGRYSESSVDFINRLVNGGSNGYYERQVYSAYILRILGDGVEVSEKFMIFPPRNKKAIEANMLAPE
ncbi:peptidase M23 [Burkholderia sp. MR1-5-21]